MPSPKDFIDGEEATIKKATVGCLAATNEDGEIFPIDPADPLHNLSFHVEIISNMYTHNILVNDNAQWDLISLTDEMKIQIIEEDVFTLNMGDFKIISDAIKEYIANVVEK